MHPPQAKTVIAQWLDRRAQGEDISIDALCVGDLSLLRQVKEIIRQQVDSLERCLDAPAEGGDQLQNPCRPFPTVPGYEIQNVLGEGGFGIVYKARQASLDRFVALKMLKRETVDPLRLEQFRREAKSAARLQHDHIVHIHEVGEVNGQPYFSQELVDGGNLAAKIVQGQLSFQEIAGLLLTLARTMEFAHNEGIVHRDLKPANILLRKNGAPKIADFGLAGYFAETANPAEFGRAVGTANYMSPEQADGKASDIGPKSDVYALGAILYEMLTGVPPFRGGVVQVLEAVRRQEPVPPTKLKTDCPRDLETICLKCLRKAPIHRYASAQDLAADLRRFLNHEPILARPVSRTERLLKWTRRQPALAGLITVACLAILILGFGGWRYVADLEASAKREKKNADDAELQAAIAKDKEAEAVAQTRLAKRRLTQIREQLHNTQLLRAGNALHGDPSTARALLEDISCCPMDLRDFMWGFYHRLAKRERLTVFGDSSIVTAVAFNGDGKILATAGLDGVVKLWNVITGIQLLSFKEEAGPIGAIAFSPDGLTLASGSSEANGLRRSGIVRIWDVATGAEKGTFKGHTGEVLSVAFSRDGTILASSSYGLDEVFTPRKPGEAKLWVVATGQERASFVNHRGSANSVAFSFDGKSLAYATNGSLDRPGLIKLCNVSTGAEVLTLEDSGPVQSIAFSPDDTILACGNGYGVISLWDMRTAKSRRINAHSGGVFSVAFSSDGQVLASGGGTSDAGNVKLWDISTATERCVLGSCPKYVSSVAFAPDGTTLASAGGRMAKLWDVLPYKGGQLFRGKGRVFGAAYSPDGTTLASLSSSSDETELDLWEVVTGKKRWSFRGPISCKSLAFSADSQTLACGGPIGTVILRDIETGERRASLENPGLVISAITRGPQKNTFLVVGSQEKNGKGTHVVKVWDVLALRETTCIQGNGFVRSAAVSSDGKTLVLGATEPFGHRVKVWNLETKEESHDFDGDVSTVAISSDGKIVAWESLSRATAIVKLCELDSGEIRTLSTRDTKHILSLAFTPDGKTLASASYDEVEGKLVGVVTLWDVATAQAWTSLRGQSGVTRAVAFSPVGFKLATGEDDGTVTMWAASSRTEGMCLRHIDPVGSVAYSPDGLLATVTGDAVRFWDASTAQETKSLKGTSGPVTFAPDGTVFATGGGGKSFVKIWETTTGRTILSLKGPSHGLFKLAFSGDGRRLVTASYGGFTGKNQRQSAEIKIWDRITGEPVRAIEAQADLYDIAFHPDGAYLASAGVQGFDHPGELIVWEVSSGRRVFDCKTPEHIYQSVALGHNLMASGSGDGTIKLWDMRTWREHLCMKGHVARVLCLAFSPNGKWLASASWDESIKIWDVGTGRELATFFGHGSHIQAIAFSPDGKSMASASLDHTARIWDLKLLDLSIRD